jgi:ABC-type Fe3+ transport system permease subunit
MKKYLAATAMIVVFLAVFIPFASSSPDGLQRVAMSLGVGEPEPTWRGLMADYSVSALGDGYVSTLAAGVLGTLMVLGISLVLGAAISRRNQPAKETVVVSSSKKD